MSGHSVQATKNATRYIFLEKRCSLRESLDVLLFFRGDKELISPGSWYNIVFQVCNSINNTFDPINVTFVAP